MINKVTIHNFKCLRNIQTDLERFTVFVGPNASGKTSILQGLDLLCEAFQSEADVEGKFTSLTSRGSLGPVELLCKSGETWYGYRTRSGPPDPPHIAQTKWSGN